MHVDLLMGDALKKTGAGNLFTVFGEPDISINRTEDGEVVVIDTDYNGDAFFVRHCYFTGGGDPYKRLKTALKAETDADAWVSMNSTAFGVSYHVAFFPPADRSRHFVRRWR